MLGHVMKEARPLIVTVARFRRKPVGPAKVCAVAPARPTRQATAVIVTLFDSGIGAAFPYRVPATAASTLPDDAP